jgi:hypothetical protein
MIKLITLAFIFFSTVALLPPGKWDLTDKSLRKELGKIEEIGLSEWKEMTVPESLMVEGKFFQSGQGDHEKFLYAGRVQTCRQGGCSAPSGAFSSVISEFFDYFILFDNSRAVQLVKIYNYEATHGQEVANKGWLKQFQEYNGDEPLIVGKNIDAISGATISVYALTSDVREKTIILKKMTAEEN